MANRIVVDPVTRIEGHLRIEVELDDNNVIKEAYSSGTMVRGFEIILKDRDPRDAWALTERVCGVCTTSHALTSVRAVESALNIKVPPSAELIRNIMCATQNVQDHVIHFYHLHALDWVDIVSSLSADPKETAKIASSISNWPKSSPGYFSDIQKRIAGFAKSKEGLGIFANAYWGHKAYKLPPEVNLIGVAHYLEALEFQREMAKIHAIFGGKNPHPNYLVGGMPCSLNIEEVNAINTDRLNRVGKIIKESMAFVEQVYIPDIMAVAAIYKKEAPEWYSFGGGVKNYLAYGELPTKSYWDDAHKTFKLPRGVILNRNLDEVHEVKQNEDKEIREHINNSWYKYAGGDKVGLHPFKGETEFNYTGPKEHYEHLDVSQKYSWLKTPRWKGHPMEVGPLSRMLVGYARGKAGDKNATEIYEAVTNTLKALDAPAAALFSTLGRTAARAIETKLSAHWLKGFYDELIANVKSGNTSTFNGEKWDPDSWPKEAQGAGLTEAPRGALGHWIKIKDKKIDSYQLVVPTTWNGSPKDPKGQMSAFEASLVGTKMENREQPLEILRTIHSFDPCLACSVHVYDSKGRHVHQFSFE